MKIIKKIVICFVTVMMILISVMSALRIHADVIPENTEYYVNDYADVISDSTVSYIESKNSGLDKGAEILVVTTEYISADDLEEYSYELFNQWEIGSDEYNNGVLIILVIKEGKYWVTVGKGLENELSAAELTRILERSMEADFDSGRFDSAVRNTFDEIYSVVSKKYGIIEEVPAQSKPLTQGVHPDKNSSFSWITVILFIVFVVIMIMIIFSLSRVRSKRTTIIYHREPRFWPRRYPKARPYEPPHPDPYHEPKLNDHQSDPLRRNDSRPPRRESGFSWGGSNRTSSGMKRTSSSPSRSSALGRSSSTRISRGGGTRGGGAGRK